MSQEERAFRAGFNAGMDFMAALEFGGPAEDENEAWEKFRRPSGKHIHVPNSRQYYRQDPCRDIYFSTCAVCGKPISSTGLELALGGHPAWKEVSEDSG